jgi:hypothetical protein
MISELKRPAILSASLAVLFAVDPLKRLGSLELDLTAVERNPRWGNGPSMPPVSLRGIPCEVGPGGLLNACEDFFGTISARLGGSLGVSDGGEVTGKPGSCGDEEVVTDAVLVAVVELEVGRVIGPRKTPSEPLTELGGLVVGGELSSEARGERIEVEKRRSLSGLVVGGGILMLGLSIVVLVCVVCS